VMLVVSMIKWIRTSRLTIKNSLSGCLVQDVREDWQILRCRANMTHIRQPWPGSGLDFQVKAIKTFQFVSSSLGGGPVAFTKRLVCHRCSLFARKRQTNRLKNIRDGASVWAQPPESSTMFGRINPCSSRVLFTEFASRNGSHYRGTSLIRKRPPPCDPRHRLTVGS